MAAPNMTVDPLPPSAPVVGDLWYNTVTGAIFLWYDDGTSAQWVTVGPGMVGPPGPPGPSSGSPGSPTRLITTPGPVVMLPTDYEVIIANNIETVVYLPDTPIMGQRARVSDAGQAANFPIHVRAANSGLINGYGGQLDMNVPWGTTGFRATGILTDEWGILP